MKIFIYNSRWLTNEERCSHDAAFTQYIYPPIDSRKQSDREWNSLIVFYYIIKYFKAKYY